MALLLQRAGRCWRHEDLEVITRPPWASGPRLVVLVPPGGPDKPELFRSWKAVYDESLLTGTCKLLADRDVIRIPADVQGLVDDVYTDPALIEGMLERGHQTPGNGDRPGAAVESRRDRAPRNLSSLYELTEIDIDPELLATRFDADSVRVLPVFADDAGKAWLDAGLHDQGSGNGRHAALAPGMPDDHRTHHSRSAVACGTGHGGSGQERDRSPPESWARNSHLRDLVLLVHRVRADGTADPASVGGREFLLDEVLGLVSI